MKKCIIISFILLFLLLQPTINFCFIPWPPPELPLCEVANCEVITPKTPQMVHFNLQDLPCNVYIYFMYWQELCPDGIHNVILPYAIVYHQSCVDDYFNGNYAFFNTTAVSEIIYHFLPVQPAPGQSATFTRITKASCWHKGGGAGTTEKYMIACDYEQICCETGYIVENNNGVITMSSSYYSGPDDDLCPPDNNNNICEVMCAIIPHNKVNETTDTKDVKNQSNKLVPKIIGDKKLLLNLLYQYNESNNSLNYELLDFKGNIVAKFNNLSKFDDVILEEKFYLLQIKKDDIIFEKLIICLEK